MTKKQLKNKIEDLEYWLQHNQSHPDYQVILRDKIECERRLLKYE